MKQKLNLSYETGNGSSYLVIRLSSETEVVNYQLAMIMDNEIKGFLPAFKRVMNGETVLYYNITSKIPLSQLLEKRKLKREEFIHLLKGILAAVQDSSEYRLPESGFLLEPEYIYVNPSNCEPGLLFLPVADREGISLRELIQDFVIHGRLELSNDNFIQVLLNTLNEEPFSRKRLEDCLLQFTSDGKKGSQANHPVSFRKEPVTAEVKPALEAAFGSNLSASVGVGQEKPHGADGSAAVSESRKEAADLDLSPEKGAKHSKKGRPVTHKATEPKQAAEASGKDSGSKNEKTTEGKKGGLKFFLVQPVLLAVIAAAAVSGIFVDEAGNLLLNSVAAVGIVVLLLEVILYREIFVNKKGEKTAEKGEGKTKKTVGKKKEKPVKAEKKSKAKGRPDAAKRPSLSGQSTAASEAASAETASVKADLPKPDPFVRPQSDELHRENASVWEGGQGIGWANQSTAAPYPVSGGLEDTVLAEETELWSEGDGSGQGSVAYLEFFENGSVSRIPLGKPEGVLVGRLRSQADFVVTNARVGKVHAKFFAENGQYFVVDINSKNGTFINGSSQRISSNVPYPLHDNDRITLADSEFTIRCSQG